MDATKLTVLPRAELVEGKWVGGSVRGRDWPTHGGVSVKLRNGDVVIHDEKYNFEMHDNRPVRNTLTRIGSAVAGKGTDFMIKFRGSPKVVGKYAPKNQK